MYYKSQRKKTLPKNIRSKGEKKLTPFVAYFILERKIHISTIKAIVHGYMCITRFWNNCLHFIFHFLSNKILFS